LNEIERVLFIYYKIVSLSFVVFSRGIIAGSVVRETVYRTTTKPAVEVDTG
jgi:hypothetical protein